MSGRRRRAIVVSLVLAATAVLPSGAIAQIRHECSKQGSCKGGSDQKAQLARAKAREKSRLAGEKAKYEAAVAKIRKKYR